MSRSVALQPFRSRISELVLHLDREPIPTRIDFTNHKEDTPMTREEFVIHCIRHHEDFPEVGEIDLKAAQTVIDNLAPDRRLPAMTADEFMTAWNVFVHDPKVMTE